MMLVDDFIKDTSAQTELASKEAWSHSPRGWYTWDQKPTNIWEKLIRTIWWKWKDIDTYSGFEWWTNIHNKSNLGWHQDKDEHASDKDKNNIICPYYGAIYYPFPHKIEGGFLEIMRHNDEDSIERLAPAYNRLIMFDPSQFHRVTKVYTGERKAFVVNLWKNHVPKL